MREFVKVLLLCGMFAGCNLNNVNKSYESLKKNSSDSELYQNIYLFELEHPGHFKSKLDLAKLNLFSGNYEESWKYLKRAEGIFNETKSSAASKSDISSMYGTYATLYLVSNNLEQAKNYVNKAYEIPKFGSYYGYLKGRIDLAMKNNEEAWTSFEKTYKKFPDQISSEELKAYMYLAADRKDYPKALKLLENYFSKGSFFPGLGLFASGVYEKNNDYEKSVFCAFLDYEYQSNFGKQNDERFVQNLRKAIEKSENDGNESGKKALQAVRALYTGTEFPIIDTDFFAYKYIYYKYKYLYSNLVPGDANHYLSIEKYMSAFPVYYWMLWDTVSKENLKDYSNWTSILERILILNKSVYSDKARIALGKIEGLTEKEAQKLLISNEIYSLLNNFISSENESYLKPVYDCISLKDCNYVYNAMTILKNYSVRYPLLKKVLADKASEPSVSSRLKDRLLYITK